MKEKVLKPNLLSASVGTVSLALIVGGGIGLTAVVLGDLKLGIITALGFAAFIELTVMLNMQSREYRFENNKMEFFEGFLNFTQTNIPYNRITDVSLEQPVLQRVFGTGTIKVNTAGSNAQEIKIEYIDNPEKEYERVKQIVDNRSET